MDETKEIRAALEWIAGAGLGHSMMTMSRRAKSALAALARMEEREALTFDRFQAANVLRCGQAFEHGLEDWSLLEWAGAVAGEVGEAANVAKKILRREKGFGGAWARSRDGALDDLRAKLADEIGDAQAYLALFAAAADLNLGECAARKFDRISEEAGWAGDRLLKEERPS